MKRVFINGVGAVSPAGWTAGELGRALAAGAPLRTCSLSRPGWERGLTVRPVPPPPTDVGGHPRLRRASNISLFATAAAREALGKNAEDMRAKKLGIVFCVTGGCVQFTRRFYDETWRNPATASPLVFPETVFNAPASHLSAVLQSPAVNYTIVGEAPVFAQGMSIAAQWLLSGQADGCLVVGAGELDWLTADATRHFSRRAICSEGAGALFLSLTPDPSSSVELIAIAGLSTSDPIRQLCNLLPADPATAVFYDSTDRPAPEWNGRRVCPKRILGEAQAAGAAFQCVAAAESVRGGNNSAALIRVGASQSIIGACFARPAG